MPTCLDIPLQELPPALQRLLAQQPRGVAFDTSSVATINAAVSAEIKAFGRYHHIPTCEIDKACQLATGVLPLVALVICPSAAHDYELPFHEFVTSSPTLKAVCELTALCTNGAHGISSVPVLDARIFRPKGAMRISPSKKDCCKLILRLLKIRRPKCILWCWRDPPLDTSVNNFGGVQGLLSTDVGRNMTMSINTNLGAEKHSMVELYCEHPGRPVNHGGFDKMGCLRLIYRFLLAFALVSGAPDAVVAGIEAEAKELR